MQKPGSEDRVGYLGSKSNSGFFESFCRSASTFGWFQLDLGDVTGEFGYDTDLPCLVVTKTCLTLMHNDEERRVSRCVRG